MKHRYSYEVESRIHKQVPKSILDALSMKGWNVFGIYEVVKRELQAEKKERKRDRAKDA